MSADPADLQAASALSPEDAARANFYGLLARLFYAPPDRALLAALAGADDIDSQEASSGLALAWRELKEGAATVDEVSAREEFDTLFIGTGKAPVSAYAGAYVRRAGPEGLLVAVRQYLAKHGLARQPGVNEPEDHVAALCDVMRHLISERQMGLERQREFFLSFVWPATPAFCDATQTAQRTAFYRPVARFARSFLEVEHALFELD